MSPVSRREFWDALAHLSAEGLTILLEGAGYGVAGAANGREALDYLRQAEPPIGP